MNYSSEEDKKFPFKYNVSAKIFEKPCPELPSAFLLESESVKTKKDAAEQWRYKSVYDPFACVFLFICGIIAIILLVFMTGDFFLVAFGVLFFMAFFLPIYMLVNSMCWRIRFASQKKIGIFEKWSDQRKNIRKDKEIFLKSNPRPRLVLDDPECRDAFARYWNDETSAAIALELAALFQVEYFFYPQDEYPVLSPDYDRLRKKIRKYFPFKNMYEMKEISLEKIVEYVRICLSLKQYDIPVPQPVPTPDEKAKNVPPLSKDMVTVFHSLKNEITDAVDHRTFAKEMKWRPYFLKESFLSYWPDPFGELALEIRNESVKFFGNPKGTMYYPNDPFLLLTYAGGDSLETVDFLLQLESRYKVSLIDSKVHTLTFAGFVELLYGKIKEKINE